MFNLHRLNVFILLLIINCAVYAQKKVACIGDSVTKGYGIKDSSNAYPNILQNLLGENYVVRNFGHSGATLLNKGHNPYTKTQAYKDAIAYKPDVIIIALGLNDTDPRNWPNFHNSFFSDYTQLIEDFKKLNPSVEVFVCKMTPIFSGHRRYLSGTRDWFHQIQNLIPEIASANGAKLIDNYSILSSRIDLFEDFLHPEEKGARILAHNVYKNLVPVGQKLAVHESLGSHMVLQRETNNIIKGVSSANTTINLDFNGKKYQTKSNHLGDWELELPKQKAGGPFEISLTDGADRIVLSDILFGDVFLASGQSNMAFPVKSAIAADSLLHISNQYPTIRVFKNNVLAETSNYAWPIDILDQVNDLKYFSGSWKIADANSIKDFSAIGYATGLALAKSQNIPIGIIDLSVGGSNTESWISRASLENDNLLAPYIHSWKYSDFVQDFCRERGVKNMELSKTKNQRHPYDPSYNFESGLSKWLDTKIKAVLWYQGESNAHNIEHHDYLFRKMVTDWHTSFKQELPFYTVQLSSINRPSWPAFRDSQRKLANELHSVYMAVSSDVGDPFDVHPRNKFIIGERLANLINQFEYKSKKESRSPEVIACSNNENTIKLTFGNCKQLKLAKEDKIVGLQYVNAKGQIVAVKDAKIIKNQIIFNANEGVRAVQYAYAPYTEANVVSENDVPVSTFEVILDK